VQQSPEMSATTSDTHPVRATPQELRAEVQQLAEEVARLNEQVERVASRATRLLEVSTALSEAESVEDVTRVVLTKGAALVEAARAALVSVEGDKLTLLGTMGFTPELESTLKNISLSDEIPVVHAIRQRSMNWVESGEEFREKYGGAYQGFTELSDMQTYVATPLTHGGEIIGALALHFREAGALGATDRTFTLLLAQTAATALHRARSYDAAQAQRRRAELVAGARAEVLGVVAHDLRNPLSLIVTSTELLEEDLEATRRRQILDIAKRASKTMNRLIEDLLDTVQLESGKLRLSLEDINVFALFRQTEETFRPLAARRRISLVAIPPSQDVRVRADAFRVTQVLGNLLGNALKFTPEGGEVRLCATLHDSEVVFEVTDTGPGIAPEQSMHLFEQFWQARTNDKRGVGLGLTIAKGIVDAHGGRIWCTSRPGAGSTFAFTLPAVGQGAS
jgi:signal transduction histidine kinase